jgi:hypothetical protein
MIITESGSFRKGHHANGHLQLTKAANFVSVADLRGQTLLLAGYHRAYAVASQIVPEGTVRVLLATLISRDSDRFLGLDSDRPKVRDKVRGGRPVLLADFFGADLCIDVHLRKQGCAVSI